MASPCRIRDLGLRRYACLVMGEPGEQAPPDYSEALDDHDDLVQRLADGDVHALDSLIEAVAGVRVVQSRTITPAP